MTSSSSWIAQIPALKYKLNLEETGLCDGPVLLALIFYNQIVSFLSNFF